MNSYIPLDSVHYIHYFVWDKISHFLSQWKSSIYFYNILYKARPQNQATDLTHLIINPSRSMPTISTMDYGRRGKQNSLKDRFWEKKSSEVKVIDGRCQQIYIKFIYSRTTIESFCKRYTACITEFKHYNISAKTTELQAKETHKVRTKEGDLLTSRLIIQQKLYTHPFS